MDRTIDRLSTDHLKEVEMGRSPRSWEFSHGHCLRLLLQAERGWRWYLDHRHSTGRTHFLIAVLFPHQSHGLQVICSNLCLNTAETATGVALSHYIEERTDPGLQVSH